MARIRYIKPDFFDNPVLAQCSHRARLLFIACWQLADRSGVFEWDVAKIRKYAFGYEDITLVEMAALLDELLARGFIQHGTFDHRPYGLVPNLSKHQNFHRDEKPKLEHVKQGTIWTASAVGTVLAPCEHRAAPVPAQLRTENGERRTENGERATDLAAEVEKPKRKRKPSSGASPSEGVTVPVRVAWLREYEKKYKQPAAWGRKENGQCAQLLGTFTASELVELVPYFFAWKNADVIDGGHSFGTGAHSFVMKIHQLRADVANAERRKESAQIRDEQKQANRVVAGMSQAERLAQRFTGEGNEQGTNQDTEPAVGAQRLLGLGEADSPDVRAVQPQVIR
jgi:hypothetical protein